MRLLVALLVATCLLLLATAPLVRGEADDGAAPGGGHTITFEDVIDADEETVVADHDDDDNNKHAVTVGKAADDDADEDEEQDADADADDDEEEKTRVMQLTAESFVDLLDTANNLLVLFVDLSHGTRSGVG